MVRCSSEVQFSLRRWLSLESLLVSAAVA